MSRLIIRGMRRATVFVCMVLVASGLVGCSGDGGSPASPSALPSAGSTTITGTVTPGGGTSVSSLGSGRSTPTFGALADDPAGLRVCVVGTDICADIGESGTFELTGDITGMVELHITGPGQDVRVIVNDVQPGETITVSIRVDGDSGRITIQSREGGTSGPRVEVCHVTGNGRYQLLEIDENALDAHLGHGDGIPLGPVPFDDTLTFDDECGFPAVDLEKLTNGEDADFSPGPSIPVGDIVTWTYVVTNTGRADLSNIEIHDSELGFVCEDELGRLDLLEPSDAFTCSVDGEATQGPYTNIGTVTADWHIEPEGEGSVTDEDESHYVGGDNDTDGDTDRDNDKVQLCHVTGNGSYQWIEVGAEAESAHLAHGDVHPVNGSCPVDAPR